MLSDTCANIKSCVSVCMLFTYLLLLILIKKDKMLLQKTSSLTKCDFLCTVNFPTKFTDVLNMTFYSYSAQRINNKCAYYSLYNE